MIETERRKRRVTAREGARLTGLSERYIRKLVAQTREDYLAEQAERREAIRAYHDDEGHTWEQTAAHFGTSIYNVQKRAYRARKERAEEELAKTQPQLPLEDIAS
uniref:Uncharacterized protein n=1 Tax=uncultured prokaryote TaxID=198431 RepID=A0A0H5QEM2_9ZZZZ|nr:unnamed protein product [uncultured bacterium]CRY94537.1 hypothetical protein [uncultured prokaryote]